MNLTPQRISVVPAHAGSASQQRGALVIRFDFDFGFGFVLPLRETARKIKMDPGFRRDDGASFIDEIAKACESRADTIVS